MRSQKLVCWHLALALALCLCACLPAALRAAGAPAQLVTDLVAGPGSPFVSRSPYQPSGKAWLTSVDGRAFYAADDGVHGAELWSSDGTPAGTHLAADLRPGSAGALTLCGSNYLPTDCGPVLAAAAFAHRFYFVADDGVHGWELWSSDGTAAGTALVRDIAPGAASSFLVTTCSIRGGFCDSYLAPGFVVVGDRLFFVADGGTGRELWATDGTPAGTALVSDIMPGPAGSDPSDLVAAAGRLFFVADDGVSGAELWTSDGTADGTTMVRDIAPGPASAFEAWCSGSCITRVSMLTPIGGRVLFFADDGAHGWELWGSDGTADGTALMRDIMPGQASSIRAGECPFCSGIDTQITALGGQVIFRAHDSTHGWEPWVSDGTPDGTQLLGDLNPGAAGSDPGLLTVLGGRLLLSAVGAATGRELWATDGTPAGTLLLRDINPGPADSLPNLLGVAGGLVLFNAADGATGRELWASDGTPAGTSQVADLNPGAGSAFPEPTTLPIGASGPIVPAAALGGRLFFRADDGTHGAELWVSDGAPAGTALVQDINPGVTGSAPQELAGLAAAPERLVFTADDGAHGRELWSLQLDRLNQHAPRARPGGAIVLHGAPAAGRLAADDGDGNPLTFALADPPKQGSVTLDDPATGAFTYTPGPGASGVDSFTFVASDGAFVSAPATVVVLFDPRQQFAPLASRS